MVATTPRVVLYQPQIPPNTGNVARSCAATGAELHLVGPLGFEISDRHLRRAGLDYWPWVPLHQHEHWQAFRRHRQSLGGRLIALSSRAHEPYDQFAFAPDDWLLFGRETDGLPAEVLGEADQLLTIPMPAVAGGAGVRSLNLSVAAAIVLFEALRQFRHIQPDALA